MELREALERAQEAFHHLGDFQQVASSALLCWESSSSLSSSSSVFILREFLCQNMSRESETPFIKRLLSDFSFEFFTRLLEALEMLQIPKEEEERLVEAVSDCFLYFYVFCSRKEFFLMTREALARHDITNSVYILCMFPMELSLLDFQLNRQQSVRRRPALTTEEGLQFLLSSIKGWAMTPDHDSESTSMSFLNSLDCSQLPPPVSEIESRFDDIQTHAGKCNLWNYIHLSRIANANDTQPSDLSLAMTGHVLLLSSICSAYSWSVNDEDVNCCSPSSQHSIIALPNYEPAEIDAMTYHLLEMLAFVVDHCSELSTRDSLCSTLSEYVSAIHSGLRTSRLGYGVEYVLQHPFRLRHIVMSQAREEDLIGRSTVSESRGQSSEFEDRKRDLIETLWTKAPETSHRYDSATLDEMVPWSVLTPAIWEDVHAQFQICDTGRVPKHRLLRLLRPSSLHWNVLGIAIFGYHMFAADRSRDVTSGGDKEFSALDVSLVIPFAFILLAHPALQVHEGLRCVSLAAEGVPHLSKWFTEDGNDQKNSSCHVDCSASSLLSLDWRTDILKKYLSTLTGPMQCGMHSDNLKDCDIASQRRICLIKGAQAASVQNAFHLSQLIVNALSRTSDKLISRSSLLALKWTAYHMHTISFKKLVQPHVSLCNMLRTLQDDCVSVAILRRLVDMCPIPQAKGVLTDTARDTLVMVPILCPEYVASWSNAALPPPPFPPNTNDETDAVMSKEESHAKDLEVVDYSERLDDYITQHANQNATKPVLPLKTLLELFVLPALRPVYSLSSNACDPIDTLENIDWFSSGLSMLKLALLKCRGSNPGEGSNSCNFVLSERLPSLMSILLSCQNNLLRTVEELTSVGTACDKKGILRIEMALMHVSDCIELWK